MNLAFSIIMNPLLTKEWQSCDQRYYLHQEVQTLSNKDILDELRVETSKMKTDYMWKDSRKNSQLL